MSSEGRYQSLKKMLNSAQREAVETLEGPVLTIAGPGTGKTQVLALRIAEILRRKDISHTNILCLTYTTAGVVAMRKRLLECIGPSAHSLQIHTFHSFCNQIIQENMDSFGVHDSESISELEQYEVIENILNTLPAHHSLFHKSSYHHVKNLLSLFGIMKSENWMFEDIQKAVRDYLNDIPRREEFQYRRKYKEYKKGDVNMKKLKEVQRKMHFLLSGAELFQKYQKHLRERGMYDFYDMILWVIRAFEENDALLARYQEQFQYILVDEFQDTNGAQKQIIDLLCSYWDDPNIFVVGDDDQSIYRFQGANMRNIMDFYSQYSPQSELERKNIKVITITKNYRSSQNILDIAGFIIGKNTERLVSEIPDISKHLIAENKEYKTINLEPCLTEYYNEYHQEWGIVQKLKDLKKQGVCLSDVAVLYQNHSQIENIIFLCEKEGIPLRIKETQDILFLPLITHIIDLLRYISSEVKNPYSCEDVLFRCFFFPFFEIEPSEIGFLALWRRNNPEKKHLKEILQHLGKNLNIPGLKKPEKFQNIATVFLELEKDFVSFPLLRFLEIFFEKVGIFSFFLKNSNHSFLLRVLFTFFSFIKGEVKQDSSLSLDDILKKIKRMKLHGISLPVQKVFHEEEGVNFITVHSSKGLEFEYVFVIGIEKKIWDVKRKGSGFSFPDTLTLSHEGDFLEEKRRLFFVALTRAKYFLEVSYCGRDISGKELDPSLFISEFSEKITPQKKQYSEEGMIRFQTAFLQGKKEKNISLVSSDFLKPLFDEYRMSVTHLNTYLRCPLTFYFENLLCIPSASSPFAAFGTAVHVALDKVHKAAQRDGSFSLSSFLEFFELSLSRQKFAFTEEEFSKFLRHGKQVLSGYYKKYLQESIVTGYMTEYKIYTHISGVPVSGNVDKLEFFNKSTVRMIDFKTGSSSNLLTKKKMQSPSEKNNFLGGDYWRQGVFYALLLENNSQGALRMEHGVFDFVEPTREGEFEQKIFQVSEEEKNILRTQVSEVYKRMLQMDFQGCGEDDCEWCQRREKNL
jgi:DNA helicase-2/ATP-dependent DNA helicase PcrA